MIQNVIQIICCLVYFGIFPKRLPFCQSGCKVSKLQQFECKAAQLRKFLLNEILSFCQASVYINKLGYIFRLAKSRKYDYCISLAAWEC